MMDTETGGERTPFEPLPPEFGPPVRSIDYDPESKTLVAVGGKDGRETMRVYQLGTLNDSP